jgi:hypothetical protein
MATQWKGFTREAFIQQVRRLARGELLQLMRTEGVTIPRMRGLPDEVAGACFDVLVASAMSHGPEAPGPSYAPTADQAPAVVYRWEIRAIQAQRYRCGHLFTPRAELFEAAFFDGEELKRILADTQLEVKDLWQGGSKKGS